MAAVCLLPLVAVEYTSDDGRIDIQPADHDRANGLNQIFDRGALENIAAHAGLQRLIEVSAVFVKRENKQTKIRHLAGKAPAEHDAVEFRH